MNAETATDLGLVTHLVDINDVPNCITEIHATGKPADKYPGKPMNENSPVVKFAKKFFSDGNMDALLALEPVQTDSMLKTRPLLAN